MLHDTRSIYFFSFLLAFCSLTYELVFAQILSVCLGGTKTQYLITISLFTSALGIGSLIYGFIKNRYHKINIFFYVEVSLTFLGIVGPFLIAYILQATGVDDDWKLLKYFLSYLIVFIIGLLSGFEIPSLFSLNTKVQGKILAFDYIGMLTASIFFPLIALPQLGTAGTCLGAATLNQLALLWINPLKNKKFQIILLLFIFFELLLVFYFRENLNQYLSLIYLKGT